MSVSGRGRRIRIFGATTLLLAVAVAQEPAGGAEGGKGPDSRAAAGPKNDAYVAKLKDAKLVEGVGFKGIAEVGLPFAHVVKNLGAGAIELADAYPMTYDGGPWKLVCVGTTDGSKVRKILQAVIVEGAGAPPTALGAKIGMTKEEVEDLYGESKPFTGSIVGVERRGARQIIFHRTEKEMTVEEPDDFKSGAYYPDRRVAFAFDAEKKVKRIAVVASDDEGPAFLRESAPPTEPMIAIDPAAKIPAEKKADGISQGYVVPAPPEFVAFETDVFKVDVPKGWTKDGDVWKDPSSPESVTVRIVEKDPSTSLVEDLDALAATAGKNRLPVGRRELPEAFSSLIGADFSLAFEGEDVSGGKEGLPLGVWAISARSGVLYATVIVTRTLHPRPVGITRENSYFGSPDGHEIARRVFRSLRIK